MARKSTIKGMPPEQRDYFGLLLREDRWTLDEMLEKFRSRFPNADTPSRSSLGRYTQQFNVLAGRMRDIQAAGTAMVAELGEDPNDKAGQLLVQAVTTLATDAALRATGAESEITTKELGELARAARAVLEARKMSLAERQEIARMAREALQREQDEALKSAVKSGGMTAQTAESIRKQILGIAS